MTPENAVRYARQIALPEVGPDGQSRICAACVLVVGGELGAETAARYLEAAGVGQVIVRATPPASVDGWLAALEGVDLVVRFGFDDDPLLGAAARRRLPTVVARAEPNLVDLVSFGPRAPDPDAPVDVPVRAADANGDRGAGRDPGAAEVLAGTLAAAEALVGLARAATVSAARIRHLRLPLDGGRPLAQEIGGR